MERTISWAPPFTGLELRCGFTPATLLLVVLLAVALISLRGRRQAPG